MSKILLTHKVWNMPEFVALCDRLGIRRDLPTRSLTIRMQFAGDGTNAVEVTQDYLGHEPCEADVPHAVEARDE